MKKSHKNETKTIKMKKNMKIAKKSKRCVLENQWDLRIIENHQ